MLRQLVYAVAVLSLCAAGRAASAQSIPKVEAVLDDFVQGGGKDGSDQLKTHYSDETLANMPRIMSARVHQLVNLYCGHLMTDLAVFAVEYGPLFGVTNETKPGFDAYDVAQHVLLALETIDGFPVLHEAVQTCRDRVNQQHGPGAGGTPKKQHAMWIVACMAGMQEKELETRTGDEVFLRWTAHIDANAAMDVLGHIVRCPRDMTLLARHQVDAEYRRDAIRKAAEAGKLNKERLEAALAKIPVPRRVDFHRAALISRNASLPVFRPVNGNLTAAAPVSVPVNVTMADADCKLKSVPCGTEKGQSKQ